jgi:transposase InsO family protein
LVARIIELAKEYGRYGYRRITALLRREGWRVNHKRVERIWRREGLKVPKKQPKRGRLWLADGSCIRRRAEHRNHVWSYDFVFERTHDGRPLRMLTIVSEFTRECLAIDVERKLGSEDVLERLAELFVQRGTPDYLRSDNGGEFTAHAVRDWLARLEVRTLYIQPGSPWENAFIESFNGTVRREYLSQHWFTGLEDAQRTLDAWREDYNNTRPHRSLANQSPAKYRGGGHCVPDRSRLVNSLT